MEIKELLIKSAHEMFLQGELPQEFIAKDLPIEFLNKLRRKIYLDINIILPEEMEDDKRQILLLVAVLFTKENELLETDVPNVYYMFLTEPDDKVYALDDIKKVKEYILTKLSLFLKIYYEKNNELEEFKNFLEGKVKVWNSYGIPPQERVFKLSRIKPLPEIKRETGFSEKTIRTILKHYEKRMDRKKLKNVKSFEQKVLDQILKLPTDKQYIKDFYKFLLDQIANGGINIEEPEELFLQFPRFNKPDSLFYN